MSQRALISVLILFCLNAGFLSAQVPTLDPSKTVNPATGEMGFALPLGSVQGISKSFPVNLYYKAGIQLDQEASPAGLGFAYEAGMITRKTVFVPDDAIGGVGYFYTEPKSEADEPTWRKVLNVILTVVAAVLTIILAIVGGPSASGGVALMVAIWVVSGVQFAINMVPLSPGNYIAGGEHTLSYPGSQGTGFLRGATDDIPDLFFVNTPFISGQFSWMGDRTNGRFVLKNAAGSNEKSYETVKILKKTDPDGYLLFEIVLSDGTRLIFDKYDKTTHFEEAWQMSKWGSYDVCGKSITHTTESIPTTWHLTKILYSDFVDGGGHADDPLDSRATNKGEWVAFEYDSISKPRIFKAFRMTQLHGTTTLHSLVGRINNQAKFPDGHTPLQPITLSWLKTIHTPVDSAVFSYSFDRKDDIWFDAENSNAIVPMPVLRTICFKNKDGSEKLTYTFHTGYDLRANSFNAFKKSWDLRGTADKMLWPFTVDRQSGNPEAKSLTLQSISVSSAGKVLPPIIFSYDENTNFAAYNIAADGKIQNQVFEMDFGCRKNDYPEPNLYERHWYIEQKDYWGYFRRNTTGSNDFNAYGSKTAACLPNTDIPYASAWSLKKIHMPSGQIIEWEYEANRFNFANGIQLIDDATPPQPLEQYGGGIRVREIKIGDGLTNKNKTISYFYTQMPVPGNFEETPTNSCGHVTALPNPYLLDVDQDKRPEDARGGLYTPANIAYEQCIVVENYESTTHTAPNGYTVYKFITAKDFANLGPYGMVDYSWKRGMLDTIEVYNSSNKLISRDVSEYEYHEQEITIPLLPYNSTYTNTLLENTTGWVKQKKTEKATNGVKSCSNLLYANDLTVESVDKNNNPQKKVRIFDANATITPYTSIPFQIDESDRAVVCKKTSLGDPTKEKIAIIRTEAANTMLICLGTDVNKDYSTHSSTEKWSDWAMYGDISFAPYYVIGAQFCKMDGNDDDDLVVVITDNATYNHDPYLWVYVFHDIQIDEANEIEFHDNIGQNRASMIQLNRKYGDIYERPVGCMIGNFHGNPDKIDFLILNNPYDIQVYPGDLNPGKDRSIYAIIDFDEKDPNSYIYTPDIYRTAGSYPYFGHCAFFTSLDDNVKPDLVVTGPGITTNAWLPEQPRPIVYHKFMNVDFVDVDATHSIIIPDGCENCASDYELFTIQPQHGWDSFVLGGVFKDETTDRLQFIFPEWSENGFHFNILNYTPVTCNGDYDGTPNRSYTQNSDGTILLSTSIPAYTEDKYKEMGDPATANNKHMIVQPCGTVTYNFPETTTEAVLKGDLSGHTDRVVAATASTWANVNDAWLPCANYAWKVPMNISGLPETPYAPFNYTTPAASAEAWKLKDSICKYTSTNLPKETATPTFSGGRLKTSIVYGHNGSISTGKVINACFEECGVFTCDYDHNQTATNDGSPCFDLANGWKKGAPGAGLPNPETQILESAKHFGEKGLKVTNSFGAVRVFKLEKGKDYIFSAWIKPVSVPTSNPQTVPIERYKVINVTYRRSIDGGATWPYQVFPNSPSEKEINSSGGLKRKQYGDWYYIELPVPASKDINNAAWNNGYQYAVAWVGCPDGNGANPKQTATVYIDDIRFYPKKAMVTSTYYDQKWYQPILSVDPNNNPSQKVEYDDFGRPVRWYKINQKNPFNVTLLQEKEYHSRVELQAGQNIQLLYPDFGGTFDVGEKINIEWVNRNAGEITIYYVNYVGADSVITQIHKDIYPDGMNAWNWTIPAEAYGANKIKVAIGSDEDMSEERFNVNIAEPRVDDSKTIWVYGTWPISWYIRNSTLNVKIECSLDAGVNWNPIEPSTPNDGLYWWYIPGDFTLSDNCKIRITDVSNPNIKISNSGVFKIKKSGRYRRRLK